MRTVAAFLFTIFVTASAFNAPLMMAVKKGAKAPVVEKKSPYPSFIGSAQTFKIKGISGGPNVKPPTIWTVPDFSDPKLQFERDPEFYKEAAKRRLTKTKTEFLYEDGLTALEKKQRKIGQIDFLTGAAKSRIDATAIAEVEGVDYFGLSADRFQLLFISVFALFTLVGCLSGNLQL
jgi:hypothetical protein